MPLPDEQELDWKSPMVSPATVQRSQTVSHKQQEKQFETLKRWFETPTKSEEEAPSHSVPVKRQRLFRTSSSQSATDYLSKSSCTPGLSQQRSNGTASEGD